MNSNLLSPDRLLGIALLVLLVTLAIWRSAAGTRLDSLTIDEPWHIVAGTVYARTGDFSLNPEHPPLTKLWVGAMMPASFIVPPRPVLHEKSQEREWVEKTLFLGNDAAAAQQRARVAMWALNGFLLLALGLAVWRALGLPWALGSAAFLAIEPTVGAHLPVVMTDLPLALTLTLAALTTGVLAATWHWRWALACGLAMGMALIAKHSSLAGLAGLGFGLWLAALWGMRHGGWREVVRRHLRLAATAALAFGVLWAVYGFRFDAAPDGSDSFNRPLPEKIAELRLPHWSDGIAFADEHRLLPRAYLWGLADTVRTGVEGRSIGMHLIWGKKHYGDPPWFSWPAILAGKMPLALLLLCLAALPLAFRRHLSPTARWALAALLAATGFHLAALIGSGGIWGGVRHALPVVIGLAVLAGGAFACAWQRRSRPLLALVATLHIGAVAMTIREPRLWEFHNVLAGGSKDAYRHFANEGLDLGQRFTELRHFHDRVIVPSGEPMYLDVWLGEQQVRAAGLNYRRHVESLEDTNVEGHYAGWFVYPMQSTLPMPEWDWDPAQVFKDMELVARFGQIGIWHGEMHRPQTRASSLYFRVMDYVYKENGDDWELVASRLEEVVAQLPMKVDAAVELGNARLRLGQRDAAIAAYRGLLQQDKVPLAPLLARQLEAHVEKVAHTPDLADIDMLRNPWLE